MPTSTEALATLGRDAQSRREIVKTLLTAEKRMARLDFDVREQVTGPIVDAMFVPGEILERSLKGGISFQFKYRSRIARDFMMSEDEVPDHVYEPQTTKLLLRWGMRRKHVVIGGAYCGDQAILLARAMAEYGGTLHCFEPNTEQFGMLKLNAKANGLGNMRFNPCGLWDTDDGRLVLVGDDSFAHAEKADAATEGAFATVTINSYGEQTGIDELGLIMLDIEGCETAALTGASRYLSQPVGMAPEIIFEVHRDYVDWTDGLEQSPIGQLLIGHGYKLFGLRDYQRNERMADKPIELVPAATAYLGGPRHGFNMVAVKDERLLDDNFIRIVPDVSPKLLHHRDPSLHAPLP